LDEIINFSGVERYIDTPVKRYSSDAIASYQKSNHASDVVISKWRKENASGEHRYRLLLAETFPKQGEFINFGSGVTLKFLLQSNITNSLLDIIYNIKNQEEILMFHHGNYIAP
jgi:hypothetical protein